MAYRVAGRPHLETDRRQGDASQLFEGRIDVQDLKPAVLPGLETVGRRLGRVISIFSAYRTDAYSEAVGGFAGDPHTRRIAVDANVGGVPIGNVPRARRFLDEAGFISGAQPGFYHGQPDPPHVQLRNEGGQVEEQAVHLPQLWIDAGGRPALANIMAAIALAESGGRVDAVGGPNTDGSYDYGLWQINSSHHYNRRRLLSQPLYNAGAAVSIQHTQGLDAWSTYKNGAYRNFLGQQGPTYNEGQGQGPPRGRPGGENADPDADAIANQEVSLRKYLNPKIPYTPFHLMFNNPLDLWRDATKGIGGVTSFLKWVAWLFNVVHILRAVEFLAGLGLFAMGLGSALHVFDSPSSSSSSSGPKRYGRARSRIASSGRVGRAAASGNAAATGAAVAREAKRARRARAERRLAKSEGIPF